MSDIRQVAALARLEQVARVAAIDLPRRFEEQRACGNQTRYRNSGIVDTIFAADQVFRHKRTIRPRQHMVVERVDLAERGAHLPTFARKPPGSVFNVRNPSSNSTPSSPNEI